MNVFLPRLGIRRSNALLLVTWILLSACRWQLVAQPYLDVTPPGRVDELSVQGGVVKVTIDTNTPLPELVERLKGPWREVSTGKGYWIGYTEDMYSIAARSELAIDPLLALARTSNSAHTKRGALLSLHLSHKCSRHAVTPASRGR